MSDEATIERVARRMVQTHVNQQKLQVAIAEIERLAATPYWRALARAAIEAMAK